MANRSLQKTNINICWPLPTKLIMSATGDPWVIIGYKIMMKGCHGPTKFMFSNLRNVSLISMGREMTLCNNSMNIIHKVVVLYM